MWTAVFGGTFNPFHKGHYEILEDLQNDPQVEEIFIMPDKIPPHKECDIMAEDDIRIEMCRIVADRFDKAELCLIEFEREGRSYSYDTVRLLKERYPNKKFVFVCGADMLVTFDRWYKYKELMAEVDFIVYPRSDIDNSLLLSSIERFRGEGMNIIHKTKIISAVSSTEIRKTGATVPELLPKEIYEFLQSKGVYGE